MKKKNFPVSGILYVFLLCIMFSSPTSLNAQTNPTVFNNVLSFNTRADFDSLVEMDEGLRSSYLQTFTNLPGFTAIKFNKSNTSIPDSLLEDTDLMLNVLNTDGVVKIGDFLFKVNYNLGRIFTLNSNDYATDYSTLVSSTENSKVGSFDLEEDVLDMIDLGIYSENQITEEKLINLCWRGSRAKRDRDKTAIYFADLTDKSSTIGSCVNYYDGTKVTSTRLKMKIEYLTLGIWSRLDIDAKIQKPGSIGINGIPLWTTQQSGTGETNWDSYYRATFKGRCRADQAQTTPLTALTHPISGENKGRKVLWERTRGLAYYCVVNETAEIYTNYMFRGPDSDAAFCADPANIVTANPARRISTVELPPFINPELIIKDNIDCR